MIKMKEKLQDEISTDDTKEVLAVYSYRTLKSAYEFAQIIKYVSYLSNKSSTHNIPLLLSGIGLKYANPQDDSFSIMDVFSGKVGISSVVGTLILRTLEFGGFFLQFLQWYQDSSASQKIIAQLPTPEPPPKSQKYSNVCPLCLKTFDIPTVLTISGYVFCYKHITKHLKKHQCCPVTNLPATIDDLVRLYDS
jgi:peroxin-12